MSLIWLLLAAAYIQSRQGWGAIAALPAHELALVLAGVLAPVALLWLFEVHLRRSDEMRAATSALERTLADLIYTPKDAEEKVETISRALTDQVKAINSATNQARVEIARIEAVFGGQTEELKAAAQEAEKNAVAVKKMLRVETSELAALADHLAEQASQIQAVITQGAESLEETTQRAASQAGEARNLLEHQAEMLDRTITRTAEETAKLGERLEFHMGILDSASVGTAEQAEILGRTLKDQYEHLQKAADETARQTERIKGALSQGAEDLRETSAEVAGNASELEKTIAGHLLAMAQQADEASHKAAAAGEALRQQTASVLADFVDTVNRIHEAGGEFEGHATRLTEAVRTGAADITSAAASVSGEADTMTEAWSGALETSLERINQSGEHFRTQCAEMAAAADHAADRMINRVEEARDFLEASAGDLESRSLSALDKLESAAEALKRGQQDLGKVAARAIENAGAVGDAFTRESQNLAAAVAEADTRAEELQAKLRTQVEIVENIGDKIGRQTTAIEEVVSDQTRGFIEATDEINERIASAERLFGESAENMRAVSATSIVEFGDAERALTGAAMRLREVLDQGTQTIDEARRQLDAHAQGLADKSDDAAARIKAVGGELEEQTGQFRNFEDMGRERIAVLMAALDGARQHISEISSLSDNFAVQAEAIAQTSESAEARLRQSAGELADNASAVADRLGAARQDMARDREDMAREFDLANQRLEATGKEARTQAQDLIDVTNLVSGTLAKSTKTVVERSQSLAEASKAAAEAAQWTGDAVARQAQIVTQAADEVLHRKQALVSDSADVARDAFLRNSTGIIEALNSLAVDLGKVLDTDISDKQWQRYLDGDRSIFSRRILRLGSRGTRLKIARKHRVDTEFRNHVTRYLEQFEQLLKQAKACDRDGTLTVTFLSSNIGKIYLLLSQALGRAK